MDFLDDAAQPQCPEDGVVMRTTATAFVCPHCGHLELIPPVSDGPGFCSEKCAIDDQASRTM